MKKLIETAIPISAINAESAKEKSLRHGHPSTLHLWWARRPLATARAVLFASIIDDPADDAERKRLCKIIEQLVKLEDPEIFEKAHAEILKATKNNPPEVWDPFAGGGTIPLEAQRLGLQAIATDLNPVAAIINKATIEIPARYKDKLPVRPTNELELTKGKAYKGAVGLAEDILYYGGKLKELAEEKLGKLYPTVTNSFTGNQTKVIAWIWARTVKCSNPACDCHMPLINSFVLSQKQKIFLEPIVDGSNVTFKVKSVDKIPADKSNGTVNSKGAICLCCKTPAKLDYIRAESKAGRMSAQLIAIVAENLDEKGRVKGRIYLPANDAHIKAAKVPKPDDLPSLKMADSPRHLAPPLYGLTDFNELFTNRQLTLLTTLIDLLDEALENIVDEDYASAVKVYLAFLIDKLAMYHSSFCHWDTTRDGLAQVFGRQAIPMVWDFAEANPFSNSSGCFDNMLNWIYKVVKDFPCGVAGKVEVRNALEDNGFRDKMISTDPPYYDNISYGNLSDFFYMWARESLKSIYPRIFGKASWSKENELIAEPARHGGNESAMKFFEDNMKLALKRMFDAATPDYPSTIYYSFKQKIIAGTVSTGWLTMLNAVIDTGFTITGTWPMRTELTTALKHNKNAISSSIVLVCRKQPKPFACTHEEFMKELNAQLPIDIDILKAATIPDKDDETVPPEERDKPGISAVDLGQAAIGFGIAIYSKYRSIDRPNGSHVNVEEALRLINFVVDGKLNEQDKYLDADSRFYSAFFRSNGFGAVDYGDAELMATSRNLRPENLAGFKIAGGRVQLKTPAELENIFDEKSVWIMTLRLSHLIKTSTTERCAIELKKFQGSAEAVKKLAYLMFELTEETGYNYLVEAWESIDKKILSTGKGESN